MQPAVLLLGLLGAAAARTLAPGPAPAAGLDASWVAATRGQSCPQACSRRGQTAYAFSSSSDGQSSLCGFGGASWAVGFESSAQPGTCSSLAGPASTTYYCKCLGRDQVPGLALPAADDSSCEASCAKALGGLAGVGAGISAGAGRQVCMLHGDVGSRNRFSVTASNSAACEPGTSNQPAVGASCACQYTLAPAPAVAVAGDPRVAAQSLATLG